LPPDDFLTGLTDPQREAVAHGDGPLLVLAGPGSGKTRVITHRAAYLGCTITQPRHVLAITFTNKAANEMASRMERLNVGPGITCCTFHSFCARLLRIHHERAELLPNFSIFDESEQLGVMKEAVDRLNLSTDNFTPSKMLALVSRAKNDMYSPAEYRKQASGWQDKTVAEVFEAYNAVLAEQNAVDFDDLLIKVAYLLRDHPDLREQLEDRYRYVLVDEYQDTNHAQYLIAKGFTLEHKNLCVTGDPDQSIYAWRGANIHNILQFEKDMPNAKVVRLEQNYRSTPQILAAADALIAYNTGRKHKQLWTENRQGPEVRVATCENQHAEAVFVAKEIRQHVEAGGKYSDVAVFYRINALSRSFETAFLEMAIPYQVARGVAFYHRKAIKDILAYLKVTANPQDKVSLLRIINVPSRGIGKTTVERLLDHAEQSNLSVLKALDEPEKIPGTSRAVRHLKSFAQFLADLKTTAEQGAVQDAVEYAVRYSGLVAMWSGAGDDDAMEHMEELVNAAAEYDRQHADGSGSLTDWLQQVSLVSDVDAIDETVGAVTLMTLHAAKGLEFDTVFIAAVEQSILPHERSLYEPDQMEEERRLCFVGMTRAQRMLTLSYVRWRDFRGVTRRQSKSQFLAELPRKGLTWVDIDAWGDDDDEDDDDDEKDIPASFVDYLEWRKGQLVRHPSFGVGRVQWIQPRNNGTHAGIRFTRYGEKTLILEYANLELVEMDEFG